MADLIDRAYLIGKFEDTGKPAVSEMGKGYDLGIAAALRVVKNAPAVNRWIPVEDALPDGNRAVLVQYNKIYADGIHKQYAVAFYGKYTHHWIEPCSGQSLNVTKWQELDIQNEKE